MLKKFGQIEIIFSLTTIYIVVNTVKYEKYFLKSILRWSKRSLSLNFL